MASDPDPLRLVVPAALAGERFDRALAQLVTDRTQAQLQKLVRRGRVKLDGRKVVRSNFNLKGGETVLVHLEEPAHPEPVYLHVDDEIAVVDKPAGMLVYPTHNPDGRSLSEQAVERLGPLPSFEEEVRPGIVHRLDRETSGVMVLARTQQAMDHIRDQFRAREVEKRYHAVAYGAPAEERFEVGLALGPVPGQTDLQRPDTSGLSALTVFRVLCAGDAFSLLECRPKTGRRHQIRVHLAARGHPVVGDKLYRPGPETQRLGGIRRQALHATSLSFTHPRTAERVAYDAPLPEDIAGLCEQLGLSPPGERSG